MLRAFSYLVALVALVATPFVSRAAPVVVPAGLQQGDQYRVAFITSTTRDATSADIADYNLFVAAAANSAAELAALATDWRAIASTEAIDARDNTGTNPAVSVGVPVYRLDGQLVAESNIDLWDDTINVPILVSEFGTALTQTFVWTGTNSDGTAAPNDLFLGIPGDFAVTGQSSDPYAPWITAAGDQLGTKFPLYAVSGILTVVPEPSTAVLTAIALMALVAFCRRHRKD